MEIKEIIAAGGFGGFIAAVITAVGNFLVSRAQARKFESDACAAVADGVAQLSSAVNSDVIKLVDTLVSRVSALEQRIDEIHARHDKEINELKDEVTALQIENAKLQASLDALVKVNSVLRGVLAQYGFVFTDKEG